MKVSALDSVAALSELAASRASYANIGATFLSLEWLRCLDKTVLSKTLTPRFYVATAGEVPVGVLACGSVANSGVLQSFTNYYSQDYRPTLFPGTGSDDSLLQQFVDRAVDAIASDRPRWQQLEFEYLRSDRRDEEFLVAALRRNGFICLASPQYENWYLTTEGRTFDAYFAERSSQLRNTITRKEKKIKKSHALDIKIFTRNDDDLSKSIGEYIAIYNSSWKNPEPYPDFIPTFARMCADLGILRMGVAYLDGQAAAAQLWITGNSRALIYKLAYAEQFAELSVGSVLSRELFRHALDIDKVAEIDYGIGSEPYKREWMSAVRRFNRLSAYNTRTIGGTTRFALRAGRAVFKRVAARLGRAGGAASTTTVVRSI